MAMGRNVALRLGCFGLALLGLYGCTEPPQSCPAVQGVYQPLYEMRSGNCGAIASANYVKIENNILIEKFANVDVTTETIVMGCSLNMTQIVSDKTGAPRQRIEGSTLDVEDANTLTGMVTLTRWDTTTASVLCAGEYDATLKKNTVTLGGAVSGGL